MNKKKLFFLALGTILVIVLSGCGIFGGIKSYNKVTNSTSCRDLEKYIERHWNKNAEGLYRLDHFSKKSTIDSLRDLPKECLLGKSKDYVLSVFGKPNRMVYIEFFRIDEIIYCLDNTCMDSKRWSLPEGYNIIFRFNKEGRLVEIVP